MAENKKVLFEVVVASRGRIPKQVALHSQLRSWLADQDLNWASGDTERATYELRLMLQKLLKKKRDSEKAPRKYQFFDDLVLKMHMSDEELDSEVGSGDSEVDS